MITIGGNDNKITRFNFNAHPTIIVGTDVIKDLQALIAFEPAGFVELATMATERGVTSNGLRPLAACLLGFRISKRAKTTNWGRKYLTEPQIQYAATDAWVSREIYLKLQKL